MQGMERIERVIAKGRRKLRLQYALDGVAFGLCAGLFYATLVLGLAKADVIAEASLSSWLLASALGPLAGLLYALLRPIDTVAIAARIDRANDFSDRLASAYQFAREPEQTAFMRAHIEDTLKRLSTVDAGKAVELRAPRDLTSVPLFAAGLAVMLMVSFPELLKLERVLPKGESEVLPEEPEKWTNLDSAMSKFREDQVDQQLKKAEELENKELKDVAEELKDLLQEDREGKVSPEQFHNRLDELSKKLDNNCKSVDKAGFLAAIKPLSPLFSDADFTKDMVGQIDAGEFGEAANTFEELAQDVSLQEKIAEGITVESYFQQVDAIHEKYLLCESDALQEVAKKLEEASKVFNEADETKELGKALEQGDLDKAAAELEKLFEKLANGEMDKKQADKVAKLLEKFAEKMDPNDPKLQEAIEKHKKELSRLQRKAEKEGKKLNPKTQRALNDAKKNLQRLQREQQKKTESKSGRAVQRLTYNAKKAADEMRAQKNQQGQKDQQQQGQKGDKGQKGQKGEKGEQPDEMRNKGDENGESGEQATADELRALDREMEGEEASQDLRDAAKRMREDAKRSKGGKSGQQGDRRANKIDDYLNRAKGQKQGSGKGGQGESKGEGNGNQGKKQGAGGGGQGNGMNDKGTAQKEQGKGQGSGDGIGDGSDHSEGPETALDSKRDNDKLKGQKGSGPSQSTGETIKAASQSGFSSVDYKKAYAKYEKAFEETLENEKIPPGYKYYVRQYFDAIRPQDGDE